MVTIIAALAVPFLMVLSALIYRIGLWTRPQKEQLPEHLEPFVISEYYACTEQAALDILETQESVDQTIILWWGLDGLRLNEDGELEWISRKKCRQRPNNDLIQYENEMEKLRELYRMAKQINTPGLAMQIMAQMQTVQNAAIISQLQPPMPGYLGYPPYFYGGCCGNYVG